MNLVHLARVMLLGSVLAPLLSGAVRADCESDLTQLEKAYQQPNLSPEVKGHLDQAKDKAVAALKKDDDRACHQAIADAMGKTKIPFK